MLCCTMYLLDRDQCSNKLHLPATKMKLLCSVFFLPFSKKKKVRQLYTNLLPAGGILFLAFLLYKYSGMFF